MKMTDRLMQERAAWEYYGQKRPADAIEPQEGQESVWDYPRPPKLETVERRIQITAGGELCVDYGSPIRILETAGAPCYYVPPEAVVRGKLIRETGRSSFCEWKGEASYYSFEVGGRTYPTCAWAYLKPYPEYEELKGWLCFYPDRLDKVTLDGERVMAQPGGYYGGWVTKEIVGPIKGEPGIIGA